MGTSPNQTPNPLYFTPDLSEFISRRMRDVSANINACQIGSITGINANGTVTVAIIFQKIIRGVVAIPNSPVMGDQIINYPALVNVPVFIYQGGGAYISMPVTVGDSCLLLFCDRDMDIWFETGQVAPPNSDRVHNINDAIALVGINNLQNLLPVNTSGLIQIVDKSGERLTESGMMVAYGGSTAPNGWLLCQGQSVAKATYPFLFAAIGYTYGGSGANFNVPDMRGQVPVGIGGTLGLTLGQEFGEVTHTLTIPEMPSHNHPFATLSNPGSSGPAVFFSNQGVDQVTQNVGGDGAHNNVQPSLGVQWIIKI